MTLTIACLEGDGIGPEITTATRRVLQAVNEVFDCGLTFRDLEIGLAALQSSASTFPETVYEQARDSDGILLGPVSHLDYPPPETGGLNPSGELRRRLQLFANARPARTREGIAPPCGQPFDLLIMRENTEGFYADRNLFAGNGEFMPTPDLALSLRKISREASLDIARVGFAEAKRRRHKVTAVHKANVLRVSDGLFLECTRDVAGQYPDVEYEELIVDAMAAHLVRHPDRFDVIVTTNMFGDILSDLASELAGGLGLGASLNFNDEHAMAQAQHGSAPDIAGRGIANPASLIGSAAMLLAWLGAKHTSPALVEASGAIQQALDQTLARPAECTPDLGGNNTTENFTARLIERIRSTG